MKEEDNKDTQKVLEEGIICKSAGLENQEVTDDELKKINKFTLAPLKADEVFTFKLILGDNGLDDRNYEPFNLNALKDLKRLYVGKTMIKDHKRTADNQIARVYDTELQQDSSKLTGAGEIFTRLIAKCYMVKTEKNADLIAEIKAGIKKEVSTSCRPKHAYCSICGVDNMKNYCILQLVIDCWLERNDYNGCLQDVFSSYFLVDGFKPVRQHKFDVLCDHVCRRSS